MPQFSSLSLLCRSVRPHTQRRVSDLGPWYTCDSPWSAGCTKALVTPLCPRFEKVWCVSTGYQTYISTRSLKLSSSTFVFTRVCSCCICWTGHKVWWPQRLVLTWTALWDVCRRFANDDIKIFYKECGDLRCKRNQVSFSCVLKPNRVTFMLQAYDLLCLKETSRWLGMVFTERGMLILCLHLRHLIIKSTSQVYQMFLHGVSACWYRAL